MEVPFEETEGSKPGEKEKILYKEGVPNNDMPTCHTPFRKSFAAMSQYKRSEPDQES